MAKKKPKQECPLREFVCELCIYADDCPIGKILPKLIQIEKMLKAIDKKLS